MQDFQKLQVWQLNRRLTVNIYKATVHFPKEERFGLVSQMRRAVISIGSTIAEACGRGSVADTARFFQMSFGSTTELLHHLITSLDLEFLTEQQFAQLERRLVDGAQKTCSADGQNAARPCIELANDTGRALRGRREQRSAPAA